MHITRPDFDRAAETVLLHPEQARKLWDELDRHAAATVTATVPPVAGQTAPTPAKYDLAHLAYYVGALIVLGSMGWFMSSAWEAYGGAGIFAIAVAYALCFVLAGRTLWQKTETRTPGGLLVALAVGMIPLAIYGLERWLGWWPQKDPGEYAGFHEWVRGGWFAMEVGTVAAGLLALWWIRFPFITAIIAFALWYMSMDLTPLIYGADGISFQHREIVSLWFGLAVLLVAYAVDVRRRWQGPDYGFWLTLFGLCAFWGGLSMLDSHDEWGRALYALLNLGLMFVGVLVDRRAFVVFGALGLNGYLFHLAREIFKDSLLFPFALSLFGLLIIAGGVWYARRRTALRGALLDRLPAGALRLLPHR